MRAWTSPGGSARVTPFRISVPSTVTWRSSISRSGVPVPDSMGQASNNTTAVVENRSAEEAGVGPVGAGAAAVAGDVDDVQDELVPVADVDVDVEGCRRPGERARRGDGELLGADHPVDLDADAAAGAAG